MNWLHSTRKGLENKSTEIEEDLSPEVMAEMLRRLDIPLKPSPRRNLFTWLIDKIPLSHFVLSACAGMVLWGIQSAIFQPPPSFDASGSVVIIEFIDAPIIEMPPLKPPLVNRARGISGGETGNGNQENDSAQKTAVDSQNDMAWDKGSWTQTKGPNGGTITALHAMPDGRLLAGTLLGGIFRLADNGETWVHASEGLHSIPPAISAFAQKGNTIYVSTNHGLHYSINSGESWQQLTDGNVSGAAIIGDTIYIERVDRGVLFSNDNGKSWTPFHTGLPDLAPIERLTLFANRTTLFAQTRGIIVTSADPVRKSQIGLLFGMAPRRHVFLRKAGEKSWTKLTIKDTRKENTVESDITKFIVSGEIVYAVTASGGLFRSTDMGNSWQRITPKAMQDSNFELTAVGNAVFCIHLVDGRVFQSTDAGDSWRMFNTNLINQRILSIAAVSDNTLYVGTQNGVFRSTDGGGSWTKSTTGITDTDSGELVSFGKALWTVTGDGIVKSVDGGDSWVPVNDGLIANDWAGVAGSKGLLLWAGAKLAVSGGKLYAATCKSDSNYWNPDTSGIYYLAEDEKSWRPIHTNMPSSVGSLDRLLISGETFYVVGHGRLYRWRVGEDRWTDLGLRVLDEEGLAVSGKTVYVAREDGKLLHSGDEGDTWTDVSQRLPNWNLQSKRNYKQFIYDLHFVGETIYAGSDYRILRLTDGDGTEHYDVFYRVYRSTDDGETWESVIDGLPSGDLNIQFVYGTTLYGANAHGIFRLRHGADSWERIAPIRSDVMSLVFDGTTFYIATTKQGVFRLLLAE